MIRPAICCNDCLENLKKDSKCLCWKNDFNCYPKDIDMHFVVVND